MPLAPPAPERGLQPGRHLDLRLPRSRTVGSTSASAAWASSAAARIALHFVRRPSPRGAARPARECGSQRLNAQAVEPLALADRRDVRLEPEPASRPFAEHPSAAGPTRSSGRFRPGRRPRLRAGPARVAEIGDQHASPAARTSSSAGGAGESGQVSDVGKRLHQQPVEPLRRQPLPECGLPRRPAISHHGASRPARGAPAGSPPDPNPATIPPPDRRAASAAAPARARKCSRDALRRTAP